MQNTCRRYYFLLVVQEITNEKFDCDFDLVYETYSEQLEMPRESDIVNLSTQYNPGLCFFLTKCHSHFLCVTNYFSIRTTVSK